MNPDWANRNIRPAKWHKGIAEWIVNGVVHISVVFSWDADSAFQRCVWWKSQGYKVKVGGPGIWENKIRKMFDDVAEWGEHYPQAVLHHNPDAVFATRGCHVGCWFCKVWQIEGKDYVPQVNFTPRPILCDNNLAAIEPEWQDAIIARYRESGCLMKDANSGFEPKSFTVQTYERWKGLIHEGGGGWRFGYDETKERDEVIEMLKILKSESRNKKRVYVLIGGEPFEDCMKRIQDVIDYGGEPYVQAVMKTTIRNKRPHVLVKYGWTLQRLRDVQRWANRWIWRKHSFDEYDRTVRQPRNLPQIQEITQEELI